MRHLFVILLKHSMTIWQSVSCSARQQTSTDRDSER